MTGVCLDMITEEANEVGEEITAFCAIALGEVGAAGHWVWWPLVSSYTMYMPEYTPVLYYHQQKS